MKKIVAIGGGEIGRPGFPIETLPIDKEIVALTGKKSPRLLFIPTASSDSIQYVEVIEKYYGKRLGCAIDTLYLLKKRVVKKEIEEKFDKTDIVYVGGGNTLKMMRRWRYLGIDKLIKKAYERGAVMAGVSAGALCWSHYGHSDSMSFYSPKNWNYIKVKCLNLIPFTLCPHYNSEKREMYFQQMIKKEGGIGIALDNCCAIEIINDTYRILASKNNAKAYRVFKRGGKVIQQEIKRSEHYSPLIDVYQIS